MVKSIYRAVVGFGVIAVVLSLSAGAWAAVSTAPPAQKTMTLGPIALRPVATLYVVVDDSPAAVDVRLAIHRGARKEGDRLMVRAFDPDGNLTYWQYLKAGQIHDTYMPGDSEIWGIPIKIPAHATPHELLCDLHLTLKGAGVHQIRLVAGARNSVATVTLSRPCEYGISFQNGPFTRWDKDQTAAYAYVPPHAEQLELRVGKGGPMSVYDQGGALLAKIGKNADHQATTIPVKQTQRVWRVALPAGDFQFRAAGFPLILCPTKEAAKAIHASVETMPNGTVVTWKFQEKIAALLPELLKHVGKASELIEPPAKRKDAWMAHPIRNVMLLNPWAGWSGAVYGIEHQNVDPTSLWSGALGGENGWEEKVKLPAPENRWDRLRSIKGLWAGASPRTADAESMAQLALLIDEPFNPYYGKKQLLYRAAAASLRDLMTLGEDETWRGVNADMTDYAGMMAFAVGQKGFPTYALVAPHMPKDVREVWTRALRHIVDRLFPEQLVTCRNQSSHYLEAFEDFAIGSGLPRYQELAHDFAQRFADGADPAGYQMEQCGPDASYIGMTHWHEAVYYRMSKDPVILKDIKRSYQFFNHTVAPEPDGRMIGGFNFNHRVGASFAHEQWGGAKGILDDVLPEVGLWAPPADTKDQRRKEAAATLAKWVQNPPATMHSDIHTPKYLYYTDHPDRSGVWPAKRKESFIKNFADELVAVKRPGYYAVIFIGKPAPSPYYIHWREDYRLPFADDVENKGGQVNLRKITPYLGGGLSLFWTPAYGSSILAANWSPVTHHGLIATQTNHKRYWEDYFKTKPTLDKADGRLTIAGQIEGQPIDYVREYRFEDHQLLVHLTLTANKAVTYERLVENLPIAEGAVKASGVQIELNGKRVEGRATAEASQMVVHDSKGKGVRVVFDQPRQLFVNTQGLYNVPHRMKDQMLKIGRVDVILPTQWKAGQTLTLNYRLIPVE